MPNSYIQKVIQQTPTRLWINNPTGADLANALAAGAIAGTSNPAYCSKLIQNEPQYIHPIIDSVIAKCDDDETAADLIYQKATDRFMKAFLPLYEKSGGTQGFVTMQDDPAKDNDPDVIVKAALRHSKVGKNYMAKIPVTEIGMAAMVQLVGKDIPICATECFSISQAIAMCELYQSQAHKTGKWPPFFITHITGIYDEEIKAYIAREKIDIADEIVDQAGCAVGRKEYWLLKERGYKTTMLGGGARGPHHFTEFVGGDAHITVNWSTVEQLNQADGQVVSRIKAVTPDEVIEELSNKLPDFQRAYYEDALSVDEFEPFAPLQRFRNSFLKGWQHLLSEIAQRRSLL